MKLKTVVLLVLFLPLQGFGQNASSLIADSVGLSFSDISNLMYSNAPSGTVEGDEFDRVQVVDRMWSDRAVENLSGKPNMFEGYLQGLRLDYSARQAQSCGTGFHGNWVCIGPNSLPKPAMGYVNCVWADPDDSAHVLAGTSGGLFEKKNGQPWKCITDNAPVIGGITYIEWIAVNPLNKNTIYLGTGSILGLTGLLLFNQAWGEGGAGIIKSFDGGQTWQQEVIPGDPAHPYSFADSITMVQKIFFTPDSTRLYAFSGNRIFTRTNGSPIGSWQEITPEHMSPYSILYDLEFVPGYQNHFFISNRIKDNGNPANYAPGVWESNVAVPNTTTDWNKITTSANLSGTLYSASSTSQAVDSTDWVNFDISIPDADSLFLIACSKYTNSWGQNIWAGLYKYNLGGSSHSFTCINSGLPYDNNPSFWTFNLAVSNSANSSNYNQKNIYYGGDVPYQSYDNGQNFIPISGYGTPLHADIRGLCLQAATNSLHGKNDRLYIATDGGVGMKPTGRDVSLFGSNSTIDINAIGLTCGQFVSMSTSEDGGYIIGAAMHDGIVTYEPDQTPQWENIEVWDDMKTMFDADDRTVGYIYGGYPNAGRRKTSVSGTRKLGSLAASNFPSDTHSENRQLDPPMVADMTNQHYAGLQSFFTQTSPTSSWTSLLSSITNSPTVHTIAINPYNTDFTGYILYNNNVLYKRNPSVSSSYQQITTVPTTLYGTEYKMVTVVTDPFDVNRVWIGMGGVNWETAGTSTINRVYYSSDGGATWIDLSLGLPTHVAVSQLIYDESRQQLYAGTDVGIYHIDASPIPNTEDDITISGGKLFCISRYWNCFSDGANGLKFPNTYITELKISYCEQKIYASTYGRSLWSSDLYGYDQNPPNTITISSSETWNENKYLTGSIHIVSGGTLTIDNSGSSSHPVIHMPKNATITVETGGQINISHATLTNSCEDCQWQGIVLKGDPSHGQNMPFHYQGNAVINDAQIEHAITAIDAGNGGAVWATNTFFYDNSSSAYLHDYTKSPGPKFNGLFKQCTFQVDPNFKGGSAHPFTCHIELYDVDQPNILGCSFYNRFNPNSDARWGTGQGIKVRNAGVNAYRFCSNPLSCTSPTNNLFIGFRSGIEIDNVWGETNRISNSTFDSCTFGINIQSGCPVLATFNTFNVGRGKEVNLGRVDCHRNVGFYAVASYDGTILENNTFNGYTSSANSPDFKSIGALYENCSSDYNGATKQVFLNAFNNLSIAAKGWGQNQAAPPAPIARNGLLFYCNSFSGNTNDIVTSSDIGIIGGRNGINRYQGYKDTAAGNLFNTSTNTNLYDNGTAGYYYYWGTGSPYEFPTNASPSFLVVGTPSAHTRNCTTHYTESGNNTPLPGHNPGPARWPAFDNIRVGAINDLNTLIDGGNTGALLGYLGGKSIMDSAAVYATVHDYSPYVSQDALKVIATNNLLSPGRLTMLLKENSEALLDEDFLDFLDNNLSPDIFTSTDIVNFKSYAATHVTDMGDRLAEISYLAGEEQMTQDMGVLDLLLDSTGANQDSVLAWYDHMNTISAEYAKVCYLYGVHNFATGDAILSNIPTKFSLTTAQTTEHSIFTKIYQVINDAYANGRSLAELTTNEEDSITAWVASGSANFRSIYIPNIIVMWKNPNPVIVACDAFVGKSGITDNDNSSHNDNKLTNGKLRVYPNPAKDHVTFEYSFDNLDGNLTLTVTNIVGQKIYEKDIPESVGKTEWDTRSVTSGVYTYKLMNGHSVLNVGKVVITK
ncbi:MAG: T9SS type A sorting domain-containing protein [Bacteroidetes bacterium]|nr:T9SS type A sorting domain-containing protein [Bacteroidota bacterium]